MYSIGSFENYRDAREVLQELKRKGIPDDEINLVAVAENGKRDPQERDIEIEGVGRAVAWGPIADTLQWDHDILGVLEHQGMRRDRAEYHAENLRRGGAILLVVAEDEQDVEEATDVMTERGALNMDQRAEQWRNQGWRGFDVKAGPARPEERYQQKVQIVEEQLQVGKQQRQQETEVRTRVESQPVEEEVRLREERARIEEHKVDRPASEEEKQRAFQEQSFRVSETQEVPVVEKQARVTGEVEVGKEAGERTEVIRDTVRKTKVDVETKPQQPNQPGQRKK